MQQLQFNRTLPLVICEKTIAEVECEIFVDFDINDEPYVSEIWVEPITGNGVLRCGPNCTYNEELYLWLNLKGRAFEAVRGDVTEAMQESV